MTAPRRAGRQQRDNTVLRLTALTAVLLGLVLIALRFLPGAPLSANPGGGAWEVAGGSGESTGQATPTPTPAPSLPPLPVSAKEVDVDLDGWYSWALMDTRTGEISGSDNRDETSTTASLIKAWIAADYLRRTTEQGKQPSDTRLAQVRVMIRDSDNAAAETLYTVNGRTASIRRLIEICGLTDSSPASNGGWSRTQLSAQDTVRMGACIADGRAAGPEWTDWLLDEMRAVRGVGDFGIRKAFPAEERRQIAIKNGWVDRVAEQEYHVNCLAIGDGWTMAVMVRYAINRGYLPGAKVCQQVAEQLRTE